MKSFNDKYGDMTTEGAILRNLEEISTKLDKLIAIKKPLSTKKKTATVRKSAVKKPVM